MALRDDLRNYENSLSILSTTPGPVSSLRGTVENLRNDLRNDFNIDDKGLEDDNLSSVISQLDSISASIQSTRNDLSNKIESTKAEIRRQEEEERRRREEEERRRQEAAAQAAAQQAAQAAAQQAQSQPTPPRQTSTPTQSAPRVTNTQAKRQAAGHGNISLY